MWSVVLKFKFLMLILLILHLSKAQDSSPRESAVNNCYTFHDVDSTWDEASTACREMGAHLVTLETTDEWNKLKSLIAEKVTNSGSYTHWYSGLRKKSGTWNWIKRGSPDVNVATDDSRWQSGQPSTNNPAEDCGEINSNYQNQLGHFNNVWCDVKYSTRETSDGGNAPPRGYICENF